MADTRVLFVDDDEELLAFVDAVFTMDGYSVEVVGSGARAIERALADRPDVVVSDIEMPTMDGWELVKRVRSHPELALVPFIFLSSHAGDEERLRGFRLGADDFLPKPFRVEELEFRVQRVVGRARNLAASLTASVRSGPQLGGELDSVGLSSVLVLLEMERATGVLRVEAIGGGESATLTLREGRVLTAAAGPQRNEEAVYEALRWSSGRFSFTAGAVEADPEVRKSTTGMLLEGARRLDDERRR